MASTHDQQSALHAESPSASSEVSPKISDLHPAGNQGPQSSADSTGVAAPAALPEKQSHRRRNLLGMVGGFMVLLVGGYLLAPTVESALRTVSTDDAYVNGHFTFVAPRVAGQVTRVLVDDNNRVRKGDLLVELDKEPFQVQVRLKQAAESLAKADVAAAEDDVRALVAQARSNRFKLEYAIEQVNNQIVALRTAVASLETSRARLARAKADNERAEALQKSPGAISQQEVDQRLEAYRVAQAEQSEALEKVHQLRVALGLPAEPDEGKALTDVPGDLNQSFSTVRQALADLLRSAAPLGIFPASYDATPQQVIEDFYKRDPQGDLDRIFAKIIPDAPQIKQAQAKLMQAEDDLALAMLNLKWCDVYAEIDGQVTRRNVNPGNNVQAGQSLMVIRSLTEIWIDANFKETQLGYLRIGQRVEMKVDMYGRSVVVPGRITGFSMGTGSTLALLPAENATGNFIKVVQRLPVRIEPTDYHPETNPLFIGLSVVPHVRIYEPPTGPHAGEYLQQLPAVAAEGPGVVNPTDKP